MNKILNIVKLINKIIKIYFNINKKKIKIIFIRFIIKNYRIFSKFYLFEINFI